MKSVVSHTVAPGFRKRLALLVVSLIGIGMALAVLSGTFAQPFTSGPKLGSPAPNFRRVGVREERVDLSQLRGKTVIVHFWSPDCEPCRDELPAMRTAASTLPDDVALVTVAVWTDATTLKEFVNDNKIEYPVIVDQKSELAGLYNVGAIPSFVVIGTDGRIAQVETGAKTADEMESLFQPRP